MPDAHNRTTEAEFSEAILRILAKTGSGKATYSTLTAMIPSKVDLTTDDRVQSDERPNEELWEQRVRNITSHKTAEGNYIAEGYFTTIPGGLAITDAGRDKVSS
jgi:hypothetical protein